MAESPGERTFTNDRHPFESFQETARKLLEVPKQELDEARRKNEATDSQRGKERADKS